MTLPNVWTNSTPLCQGSGRRASVPDPPSRSARAGIARHHPPRRGAASRCRRRSNRTDVRYNTYGACPGAVHITSAQHPQLPWTTRLRSVDGSGGTVEADRPVVDGPEACVPQHVAATTQSQPQHLVFSVLTDDPPSSIVYRSLDRRRPASFRRHGTCPALRLAPRWRPIRSTRPTTRPGAGVSSRSYRTGTAWREAGSMRIGRTRPEDADPAAALDERAMWRRRRSRSGEHRRRGWRRRTQWPEPRACPFP
jgi:hypothetical protein